MGRRQRHEQAEAGSAGPSPAFRVFQWVALTVQARLMGFDPAVRTADPACLDTTDRPVFLLGPPRSGTTLLYQYLLHRHRLTAITNLMALAPRFMVRLHRLSAKAAAEATAFRPRSAVHGFVPGLLAPSEAGRIMDRWFGGTDWQRRPEAIRATFAALSAQAGAPVLVKSLTLGPHLARLRLVFPHARFILCYRDVRLTAQSILTARRVLEGRTDRWWSVAPEGWETMRDRPPEEQVVWQVRTLQRGLSEALADHGATVTIRYEDFCADPDGTGTRIAAALNLAPARFEAPPTAPFPVAARVTVDAETWHRIEAACDRLDVPSPDRAQPLSHPPDQDRP